MRSNAAENGVEVLNALFRDATAKHGSNMEAILNEVRLGVDGLNELDKEAALRALDMALCPSTRQH